MSKYQPLSERLAASPGDEWLTSFAELEGLLGFPLPKTARTSRTWWANDPQKAHSRSWAAHGWAVGDVDHAAERVMFRRGAASADLPPTNLVPAPSRDVQPPAMRKAAESASMQMHVKRALGESAMVMAGLAVVAGLGALLVRSVMRRR
ncbi:MAG: hypothetical protein JWQ97_1024 [Phenylobacterium sp.]|nr:hypothetical protein [Phenylobacterium sp.]